MSEKEIIEELKISKKKIGELYPIIINKRTGRTLSGMHRGKAGWESRTYVDIPPGLDELRVIAASNAQRIIPLEEKQCWITECRQLLQEKGMKGTQKEIAEALGKSQAWVSINDPVKHYEHHADTILPSNIVTPPHKPESAPPKIELEETPPSKPSPSEGEIPEVLKEHRCQYCKKDLAPVNEFLIKRGILERKDVPKTLLDHEKYCPKNPHRIEKPTEKKPRTQRRERTTSTTPREPPAEAKKPPSAQEILEYFNKDNLVRCVILSVHWSSKCDKGNCSECEMSTSCDRVMSYLPIKPA